MNVHVYIYNNNYLFILYILNDWLESRVTCDIIYGTLKYFKLDRTTANIKQVAGRVFIIILILL